MNLLLIVCVILVALPAVHAEVGDDGYAKAQQLLVGFSCPEGASLKACQSFKDLARAGDKNFLMMFIPPSTLSGRKPAVTYVVFDHTSDTFWLISIFRLGKSDVQKMCVVYTMYQNEFIKQAETVSYPFQADNPVAKLLHNGVHVELDADTLKASGSYPNDDKTNVSFEIAVKVSTLRENIYWTIGSTKFVADGKAVKFTNEC